MHRVRLAPALTVAALLLSGTAGAQTAPAPAAVKTTHATVATTSKTTRTNVPVQRTAKSLNCSKQADAKNLHGKPRKSFMADCKKA